MPINKTSAAKLKALEIKVLRIIRKSAMLVSGEQAVVAVSGGADSTSLLLCLHALAPALGCSLTVAHLNHCLRGAEGDADEAFVRHMSANLGLPFESETVNVKEYALAAKQNLEHAAREKRYEFLRRTAEKVGARKIAVGHNQNDQAETALFRFLRGSGIEGLSAIHPVVDDQVIRPLLECSREDILEYLKQCGCEYREDSSNADLRFSRNRIRRELIPYLEENFNPSLNRTIARETALIRETWSFVEAQALQAFEGMHRPVPGGVAVNIAAIPDLHPALQKQVLRCALRYCLGSLNGITLAHIEALLSLCTHSMSGARIPMPHKAVAIRQFDELLILRSAPDVTSGFCYELDVPGYCYVAEARAFFRTGVCRSPEYGMERDYSRRAVFELSALQNPLVVRSRIAGDRYGGVGHKKVKKMLIDGRIPQTERDVLPMVVTGDDVIWIPGFRPAKAYEAEDLAQPFVSIEFDRDSS